MLYPSFKFNNWYFFVVFALSMYMNISFFFALLDHEIVSCRRHELNQLVNQHTLPRSNYILLQTTVLLSYPRKNINSCYIFELPQLFQQSLSYKHYYKSYFWGKMHSEFEVSRAPYPDLSATSHRYDLSSLLLQRPTVGLWKGWSGEKKLQQDQDRRANL